MHRRALLEGCSRALTSRAGAAAAHCGAGARARGRRRHAAPAAGEGAVGRAGRRLARQGGRVRGRAAGRRVHRPGARHARAPPEPGLLPRPGALPLVGAGRRSCLSEDENDACGAGVAAVALHAVTAGGLRRIRRPQTPRLGTRLGGWAQVISAHFAQPQAASGRRARGRCPT